MKRPLYNAIHSLFHDPRHFVSAACIRLGRVLPDKAYLKLMFRLELGQKLNLDNPQTFNEKLQWLKLYHHRPDLVMMADKLAVKEYVASRIGPEYVIPLLGTWKDPKDIDWDCLPQKFVLKTNHDGGNFGVVICKDKDKLDKDKAIKRLQASLRRSSYIIGREWPYKNIPRTVFAEEYLEEAGKQELTDYKFYCFDGKVRFLFIASGRQEGQITFDYFDEHFNHINVVQTHPPASVTPEKPAQFDLMIQLAEKLSRDIPHVRVDFYLVDGKVYFGEYTFFTHGGWAAFDPDEYDYKLGSYIHLPEHKII